ncbi:NAD(P)-dependent oxidoreductase [Lysobacter sp. CFH 32150]|uniref:NAD-dependent epimerase/dehydratase family protein n=1 Tax=Lysobacter sp. CFH 32150 TaxID=2927128 RepID=UPI001FA6AD83|nr:NAD(P)-dependent oxidoreductase [Lysobacter sp. CFH 32150]MCI4567729.1 NAD(P)-dependent oxidoreductase [Lysobacter sp. CFH 32150]
MNFTVIGASGFIGSALCDSLRASGHSVSAPDRSAGTILDRPLGHVVYAAGVTADFRTRPFDTFRANTGLVAEILEKDQFDSFLYLSSARLYRHAAQSGEATRICVEASDPEDFYDLTKLTSEALCHASGHASARVVRLANVVGQDFRSQNFLYDLIRSACDSGVIELRSDLASAKDYVLLEDVVRILPMIALSGRDSCYNLGSGQNLTHAQLLEPILATTGATLKVVEGAPCVMAPQMDISKLRNEFGFRPTPVLPSIAGLINHYRKFAHAQD